MAEDWFLDVKKYAPTADDAVIAGIVRHCGIALQSRDASLVAFSDKSETDRVRESFLKKKLALTDPDPVLDGAIAAVGERMKADRTKNRVTVYYLLAEHFGKLGLFTKAVPVTEPVTGAGVAGAAAEAGTQVGSGLTAGAAVLGATGLAGAEALRGRPDEPVAPPATPAAGKPVSIIGAASDTGAGLAAGAATLGAAGLAGAESVRSGFGGSATLPPPPVASLEEARLAAGGGGAARLVGDAEDEASGGSRWWVWLLLGLLALAVLWYLFAYRHAETPPAAPSADVSAPAAAPVSAPAAPAPAATAVTIPTGAGVTSETVDGKPVVRVYFDTGKSDVVPAFGDAAGALKTYLDGHAGSSLAVSGYNDKTGNAALNAELSKHRAQAVQAALVAANIPAASISLQKPADTTDASGSNAEARRVEVTVK